MKKQIVLDDIHPKSMKFTEKMIIQTFNNKHEYIASLKVEGEHGDSVKEFKKLISHGVDIDEQHVDKIKTQVRNSLIKRGLITGTVYEGFKYDVEGIIVDYAELASGNPECMLKPVKKYDKWFYELYINMSIPWNVDTQDIKDGAIRAIETIRALEELNIEMKINIVISSDRMYRDGDSYLMIIPICNHLEFKDYNLLYPFMTGEFLRGPMFQTMKSGKAVNGSLGYAFKMDNTLNLWELKEDSVVALADRIVNDVKGLT